MFKKRMLQIDKSISARMERIQYSNRNKIRPFERKVARVVSWVFIIGVGFLLLANDYCGRMMTKPDITKEVVIQSINPEVVPVKIGASDFQNEMISYAWDISGKDFDFVKLIEAESGWVVDAVSGYNSNGTRDWGLCQISSYWHPQIVNDPKFNDWKWEIDTCYQLYDGGVTFYGLNHIDRVEDNFKLISK